MAQGTTTIESVWAAKGNLPDNAIVATADGKYPALDGSLITNISGGGSGDLLAANNLSELTATASVARTNLELGATNTVEFGALETSQFNFPNLTTAELNAVTDAVAGDAYFDSDRGQFVRFTGAASYDVVTSRVVDASASLSADPALTLDGSRLNESGLLIGSTNPSSLQGQLSVWSSKNPQDAPAVNYVKFTSGVPVGWYDINNTGAGIVTAPVFTPGTLLQINTDPTENDVAFVFNKYITSDVTPVTMGSRPLKAGTTYSFEFSLDYLDLLGSNFQLGINFSGIYEDSGFYQITLSDTRNRTGLSDFKITSPDEDFEFKVSSGSFAGVAGPNFGSWLIKGQITPTSDGDITINGGQVTSSVDHLFYSFPSFLVTSLSD